MVGLARNFVLGVAEKIIKKETITVRQEIVMADYYNHSYRQLFSHPELIRDLLEGFVH